MVLTESFSPLRSEERPCELGGFSLVSPEQAGGHSRQRRAQPSMERGFGLNGGCLNVITYVMCREGP